MAPRVKFLGESADMLEYEDAKGNRFSVPKQVVRSKLPAQYEQELAQGFEAFKQAPAQVQEAERQRYNELAAGTRRDDFSSVQPLPDDHRGLTRTFMPSAAPFGQLNSERLLGPTPAGPSLSDRPQMGLTQAVRQNDPEALQHEGLHASAADPTEGKHYTDMGPREREQWRVFSALQHNDNPHRPHEVQPAPQYDVEIGAPVVKFQPDRFEVEVGPSEVHGTPLISNSVKDDAAMMQDYFSIVPSEEIEKQREVRRNQAVDDLRVRLGLL